MMSMEEKEMMMMGSVVGETGLMVEIREYKKKMRRRTWKVCTCEGITNLSLFDHHQSSTILGTKLDENICSCVKLEQQEKLQNSLFFIRCSNKKDL